MDKAVRVGLSPCPNDTFAFHALLHGLVAPEQRFEAVFDDVEALNQRAEAGALPVVKVSVAAYGRVQDAYALLGAGGALGHGVGPLLVVRDPDRDLAGGRIATPGGRTTASLLLALYAPEGAERVPMRYDRIMPAVAAGEVDAGLIIHESRFTYREHGLHARMDLGERWTAATGLPVPLGAIAVRRDLDPDLLATLVTAVPASVRAARRDPGASAAFVAQHAQEMDPEVRARHIRTYVNDFTEALGTEGRDAIRALLQAGAQVADLPAPRQDLFLTAAGTTGTLETTR